MPLITNGDCSAGFGIQPQSQHGDHTVGNCGLLREPHHNQVHRILYGVKFQCLLFLLQFDPLSMSTGNQGAFSPKYTPAVIGPQDHTAIIPRGIPWRRPLL